MPDETQTPEPETKAWWHKTWQLCLRGAAMTYVTFVGAESLQQVNENTFDVAFSADAGKAAAVGAVLSLAFSFASKQFNDKAEPTV